MNRKRLVFARLVTAFAWVLSVSLVLIAFWAFAFDRYHPESEKHFDGFGRELHSGESGMFGSEYSPGLLWEIADTAAAIFLFGVCSSLFVWGRRLRNAAQHDQPKPTEAAQTIT